MNIKIFTDEKIPEDLIEIHGHPSNPELYKVQEYFSHHPTNKFAVMVEDQIVLVDKESCIKFYAENKKVYVVTEKETYITRLTLGEVENQNLPYLIRISKSEIININYVKQLDLSFQGTIACEMKDGSVSYVSRRKLKEFRKKLGL